jgi:histidyl-tRNA synthetase
MLQKPRGTRDFLPEEMEQRREIEMRMRRAADLFGYHEVLTPTFENQEIYTIKSGEGIIGEMYTFEDKGGRKLALRPEGTAAILRMYVNEAKVLPKPIRWCYFLDCFRYERPQKGRYRQFWQFGAELIGADTAAGDAEIILLADSLLRAAGVKYSLQVGHLAPMKHILSDLDDDDRKRVMALLDKRSFEELEVYLKNIGRPELYDTLITLTESRTIGDAKKVCGDFPGMDRMEEMLGILDGQILEYTLNLGIVRGLDYYTGMVFEGFAENLGAENQIIGGGSYRLAHLFGGEDTPSCGFGIGFDRVVVSRGEVELKKDPLVAVLYTQEGQKRAFEVATLLRKESIPTEINLLDRGIGAQIKHAAKNAHYAVLIGKNEVESGIITLKDLTSGDQKECTLDELPNEVK